MPSMALTANLPYFNSKFAVDAILGPSTVSLLNVITKSNTNGMTEIRKKRTECYRRKYFQPFTPHTEAPL